MVRGRAGSPIWLNHSQEDAHFQSAEQRWRTSSTSDTLNSENVKENKWTIQMGENNTAPKRDIHLQPRTLSSRMQQNNMVLTKLGSLRSTSFLFIPAILKYLLNGWTHEQSLKAVRLIVDLVCGEKKPSKKNEPLPWNGVDITLRGHSSKKRI